MKAAFEVVNPNSGHRYKIYPDGQIEGFGDATLVINRIQPSDICLEDALKHAEIDSLRGALKAIAEEIKPQLLDSELELIVWWGRQVERLQAIARAELQ